MKGKRKLVSLLVVMMVLMTFTFSLSGFAGDDQSAAAQSQATTQSAAEETAASDTSQAAVQTATTDTPNEAEPAKTTETGTSNNNSGSIVTYHDAEDDVKVTVTAKSGVLPENAKLNVKLLSGQEKNDAEKALRDSKVKFDGSVALDISFTVDDEEIEPEDGQVNVSLDMDSKLLGDEVDKTSLLVSHITDDKAEPVADTNKQTDGTVSVKDNNASAEFVVDSFSTFTITYLGSNPITVHLVDEEGTELPGGELTLGTTFNPSTIGYQDGASERGSVENQNTWVSIKAIADNYASKTGGYTYDSAYIEDNGNNFGTRFDWIKYKTSSWYDTTSGWYYSADTAQPIKTDAGTVFPNDGGSYHDIYIKYSKVADITQKDSAKIEDNIAIDGSLKASSNKTGVNGYHWYKSTNGKDYQRVFRTKVTGDLYNMSKDGSTLNVALDGGAHCWYKMVPCIDDEEVREGDTLLESNPYLVPYYDELQNGSFETPDVRDLSQDIGHFQYANGTAGLVWQTTGSDKQIEIGRVGYGNSNGTYNLGKYETEAPDGQQFAELNAEAAGALYQDVLTTPGSDLNWWLSHRARANGTDTMYLVIAPANEVSNITTQDSLKTLMNKIRNQYSGYTEADGYFIKEIKDGNSWGYHSSGNNPYKVPDNQYLTRFFFVAGNTAANNDTIGNLLDQVGFSSQLPPPNPGTANIKVVKQLHVNNLDALSNNYQVTVKCKVSNDNVVTHTFTKDDFKKDLTAEFTFQNIRVAANQTKTCTVSEEATDESANYTVVSKVKVGDADLQNGTSASVQVKEQQTAEVTFHNTYTPEQKTLTVRKIASGAYANKSKKFTISYEANSGESGTFNISEEDGAKTAQIPYGSKVTITEKTSDYTPSIAGTEGSGKNEKAINPEKNEVVPNDDNSKTATYTFTMMDDSSITVTNTAPAITITGLKEDSNKWILGAGVIGLIALLGLGLYFFEHRARRRYKH